MLLKRAAILFGAFLLVGILGFIPAVAPNQMLLDVFHINAAHNLVHLLSGAVALGCGLASEVNGPTRYGCEGPPALEIARYDRCL
jgi:Domain of unknown function (DUF4383)